MEKVRAVVAVYIPRCLTPALLTRVRSNRKVWGILYDSFNTLSISESCLPLWDWIRVRLLADYVGDLDSWLSRLPTPTQSEDLTNNRVALLKQVLTSLAHTVTATVPDLIASSLPCNLPLPPPPAKNYGHPCGERNALIFTG